MKHVKHCACIFPFLLLLYSTINCAGPLVNPWNNTQREIVSAFFESSLIFEEIGLQTNTCIKTIWLSVPSLRNLCLFFYHAPESQDNFAKYQLYYYSSDS